MSRNLLENRPIHSHLDDLESFYYVLCWLICEYDGPGDVNASRLKKTPQQLKDLDSRGGAKKIEHFQNDFDLPVQPWFGEIFREMTVHLHGFFHCRTKPDGPTPDPEHDYEEFISHIRRAIERLGAEDDVGSAPLAGSVSELEDVALTNRAKRKVADIVPTLDEPNRKRPVDDTLCRAPYAVPERPRRTTAKYQTSVPLTRRRRRK